VEILRSGRQNSGTTIITVPPSCVAILNVAAIGNVFDTATVDHPPRIYLSADLSETFSSVENGNSVGVLCRADTVFPKIPVAEGERLLVAFGGTGVAIIYFETV